MNSINPTFGGNGPDKNLICILPGGHAIRTMLATGGLGASDANKPYGNCLYIDSDTSVLDAPGGHRFEEGGGTVLRLAQFDVRSFAEAALEERSSAPHARIIHELWRNAEHDLLARALSPLEGNKGASGIRTVTATACYAESSKILEAILAMIAAAKKRAGDPRARTEVLLVPSTDGSGGSGGVTTLIYLMLRKLRDLDFTIVCAMHNTDQLSGWFASDLRADLLKANTRSCLIELECLAEAAKASKSSSSSVSIYFLDGGHLPLVPSELELSHARQLIALYRYGVTEFHQRRAVNEHALQDRGCVALTSAAVSYEIPAELQAYAAARAKEVLIQGLLDGSGPTPSLEGLLPSPIADCVPPDRTATLLTSTSIAGLAVAFGKMESELAEFARDEQEKNQARAMEEKQRVLRDVEKMLGEFLPTQKLAPTVQCVEASRGRTEKAINILRDKVKRLSAAENGPKGFATGKQDEPPSWLNRFKALSLFQRGLLAAGALVGLGLLAAGDPLFGMAGAVMLLGSAGAAAVLLRSMTPGLTEAVDEAVRALRAKRELVCGQQELAVLLARQEALDLLTGKLEALQPALAREMAEAAREKEVLLKPIGDLGRFVAIAPQSFESITKSWGVPTLPAFESIESERVAASVSRSAQGHAESLFAKLSFKDLPKLSPTEISNLANRLIAGAALPSGHQADPSTLPRPELFVATAYEVREGASEVQKLLASSPGANRLIVFSWARGLKVADLNVVEELSDAAGNLKRIPTLTLPADLGLGKKSVARYPKPPVVHPRVSVNGYASVES